MYDYCEIDDDDQPTSVLDGMIINKFVWNGWDKTLISDMVEEIRLSKDENDSIYDFACNQLDRLMREVREHKAKRIAEGRPTFAD